jgi:hypothetical protein
MAKPNPKDVTDAGHHSKRRFSCGHNVFRLIGADFENVATVTLDDPEGAAVWTNPADVIVITPQSELEIKARATCRRGALMRFVVRVLGPVLKLLGIPPKRPQGIGSLTVTVTNNMGQTGTLSFPDHTITYGH